MKKLFAFASVLALTLTGCATSPTKEHVHEYDLENVDWFWQETSSGYKASAIFSCLNCEETKEVAAKVTSKMVTEPTCISDGLMRYTALATFQEKDFTDYREVGVHIDDGGHNYVEVIDPQFLAEPATCTENAVYYLSCEHCHRMSDQTFEAENSKLPHQLSHHNAKTPTCSEVGNIEYWTCDNCHQYFSDSQGQNVIDEEDVILPLSNNHQMTYHEGKTSTCSEHGNVAYYQCDLCHRYFSDSLGENELSESDIILPFAHDMTFHQGQPATCYSTGLHDYYTCSYEPGVLYKDSEGNEKFNSEADLVIPQLEHEFDEEFNCVHCHESFKEIYELEDADNLDRVYPISTSSLDMGDEFNLTPAEGEKVIHYFSRYDFTEHKGIDLWLEYNYELTSDDGHFDIYLFNQRDESGAILRLQNNRGEDDGINYTYIHTRNGENEGTTIPTTSKMFYFPRISGVKSTTTNIIHVTANCIDETKNIFEIDFTLGVKGQALYYPSANPEDKTNTKLTFNIELGADYFLNGNHNFIRFSAFNSANITLKNYIGNETPYVTFLNANKEIVGKTDNTTLSLPNFDVEGKVLLGWFDLQGNKVEDGQVITSKTIIRPIFTAEKENMFSLRDYGLGKTTYESMCKEQLAPHGVSIEEGNEYDTYFIYKVEEMKDNDNYAIFGFPYDVVDEANRVLIRINNFYPKKDSRISGYIYGSMIGAAGSETRFDSSTHYRDDPYSNLLVHFTVHDNGNDTVTLTVEITNLVNDLSYSLTKDVTFTGFSREPLHYGVTSQYVYRNVFAVTNAYNCDISIDNVF